MAVVMFVGSSLNLNANQTKSTVAYKSTCELYAEFHGTLFVANGLNYYEGYFGAYSICLNKLGAAGVLDG
ncbi:hypothetical protein [Winogradskyella arenosi]|uniref:Uncharacterized protein n=1 Tax=Winogradskyella arenosi TaxID=533325 RepID=A0A368ZLP5_9FLAO|nr:hypothetical protein [Winogradskyella arenosi]RCW93805.1 hypothetical protein DFQ08_101603 [Winogradskyella arenosi]